MKIIDFVSSLLPNFGRNRLQEDLRIIRTELENTTIPTYKEAEKVFGNSSKVASLAKLEKVFKSTVKEANRNSPGIVREIRAHLESMKNTLDKFDHLIDSEFDNTIISDGLTLRKAHIVRLLELASFISRFSLRFLNYVYIKESEALDIQNRYTDLGLSPGEIKLIENNFYEYCLALNVFGVDDEKIEKALKNIPDILVNQDGQAALAALNITKSDPLGTFVNMQGFAANPIYHIGLLVAEYQSNRYKEMRELKTVLELRLLQLEKIRNNNPDAALDKEIKVIQGRVDTLSEKIRKEEASVQ